MCVGFAQRVHILKCVCVCILFVFRSIRSIVCSILVLSCVRYHISKCSSTFVFRVEFQHANVFGHTFVNFRSYVWTTCDWALYHFEWFIQAKFWCLGWIWVSFFAHSLCRTNCGGNYGHMAFSSEIPNGFVTRVSFFFVLHKWVCTIFWIV